MLYPMCPSCDHIHEYGAACFDKESELESFRTENARLKLELKEAIESFESMKRTALDHSRSHQEYMGQVAELKHEAEDALAERSVQAVRAGELFDENTRLKREVCNAEARVSGLSDAAALCQRKMEVAESRVAELKTELNAILATVKLSKGQKNET